MLTIVSWIGWLASPVLSAVVPGISPKFIMWAACALAALVLLSAPAGAVWIHMHGEVKAARADERAAGEVRIAEDRAASAESLSHLLGTIKTGEETAVEPVSKADELALCKKSRQCLEGLK